MEVQQLHIQTFMLEMEATKGKRSVYQAQSPIGREMAHLVPTSMQHSKVKNTLDLILSHYRNVRPLPLTST